MATMSCRSDRLYSPLKIEAMQRRATLIVDTREHDTPELRQRLSFIGLPWTREKLDYGDYAIRTTDDAGTVFQPRAVIERKMSCDELALCFGSERDRFQREFERAKAAGGYLWLVVEGCTWSKLIGGEYRSKMLPQSLIGSMVTWSIRYNAKLTPCSATESPTIIRNILMHELAEEINRRCDDGND